MPPPSFAPASVPPQETLQPTPAASLGDRRICETTLREMISSGATASSHPRGDPAGRRRLVPFWLASPLARLAVQPVPLCPRRSPRKTPSGLDSEPLPINLRHVLAGRSRYPPTIAPAKKDRRRKGPATAKKQKTATADASATGPDDTADDEVALGASNEKRAYTNLKPLIPRNDRQGRPTADYPFFSFPSSQHRSAED